jgi:hypothetical protein
MEQLLKNFKENIPLLLQFGSWLFITIAGIVTFPSFHEYDTGPFTKQLSFLCAALSGILLFLVYHYKARKHAIKWWIISLVAFAGTIFSIILFNGYMDKYTVPFGDGRVTVGNIADMNAAATQRRLELEKTKYKRPMNTKDIVLSAGGQTETIWDHDLLDGRRHTIMIAYAAVVFFITCFLMTIVQAITLKSPVNR